MIQTTFLRAAAFMTMVAITACDFAAPGIASEDASIGMARPGPLVVTKDCSEYTGQANDFCTITSSNVQAIPVGSRVVYATAAGATSLDTDIIIDTPGPGNNAAFGHCVLDFATGTGLCTIAGGTGRFTRFTASANVSYLGGPNWAWEGTYAFGVPR